MHTLVFTSALKWIRSPPMTEVIYRRSEPGDKSAILGVLRQNAPGIDEALRSAIFDWQFGDANVLVQGRPAFWVATVNDEVAGVNGMMPVQTWIRGQQVPSIWSCDTLVLEKFRGLGIGKGLLQRVSQEAPVVLGYGISDMSDPILAKVGWDPFDGVMGLYYSINEPGAKGTIKNIASSVLRLTGAPARPKDPVISVSSRPASFDGSHDQLWKSAIAEDVGMVIRDTAYLNWRYRDHPSFRYEVLEAFKNGQLQAVLVLRHDELESVIVDYVGERENVQLMNALLGLAVRKLIDSDSRRIRCETSLPALQRCLRQFGFRPYLGQFRFRSYAHPDHRQAQQPDWFVMTGDSDNDCSQISKTRNTLSK